MTCSNTSSPLLATDMRKVMSPAAGYSDAAGYDSYMGGWSVALAPPFLRFALRQAPRSLLDVGTGTGNLLAAAAASFPQAQLSGIDPSSALLGRARSGAGSRRSPRGIRGEPAVPGTQL